jgi:putative membrane protein
MLILKGSAMGMANVIPGVSGGTVALITGIYEDLINTLKSFDWHAVKLLFKADFRKCFNHINGPFACAVGIGVIVSVFSAAKILEHLLSEHETLTMAFFFGLILASIFLVARQVPKWNPLTGLALLAGIAGAAAVLLIKPLSENPDPLYVFLCGVVAMCSMILPGISGSYILILMGNYALLLDATSNVQDYQKSLSALLPFTAGCAVGLLGFARVLSFILDRFKATTLAMLTGFVAGSLAVIWPWKTTLTKTIGEKTAVTGYQWNLPEPGKPLLLALLIILAGSGLVLLLDKLAGNHKARK